MKERKVKISGVKERESYRITDRSVYIGNKREFIDWSFMLMEIESIEVGMEFMRDISKGFDRSKLMGLCFVYVVFYEWGMCVDYLCQDKGVVEWLSSLKSVRFGQERRHSRVLKEWGKVIGVYNRYREYFSREEGLYLYSECCREMLSYPCFGLWGCWKMCDVLVYMGLCKVEVMRLGLTVKYGGNELDCNFGLGKGVCKLFGVNGKSRSVLSFIRQWGFDELSFIGEFSELGVKSTELESLLCKWGSGYKVGSESEAVLKYCEKDSRVLELL